jgi:hypothetical protein
LFTIGAGRFQERFQMVPQTVLDPSVNTDQQGIVAVVEIARIDCSPEASSGALDQTVCSPVNKLGGPSSIWSTGL